MEWFIKKNSTQPILQLEFSLNGRSDFNKNENLTNFPSVYISFLDVNNGNYLSTSKTCYITKSGLTTNPNVEEYYVNYQFTNKETKNIGRYEAQLSMIGTDGTNILPTSEKLYINVIDSFSADYYGFDTDYKLERPCCNGKGITPEPEPTPTPSITSTPSMTPTNTPSMTPSMTPTNTPSMTPTQTPTPSITATITPTPTFTPTNTQTPTKTVTPTVTQTPTNTITPSITSTLTPTPSITPTTPECRCWYLTNPTAGSLSYISVDCNGNVNIGGNLNPYGSTQISARYIIEDSLIIKSNFGPYNGSCRNEFYGFFSNITNSSGPLCNSYSGITFTNNPPNNSGLFDYGTSLLDSQFDLLNNGYYSILPYSYRVNEGVITAISVNTCTPYTGTCHNLNQYRIQATGSTETTNVNISPSFPGAPTSFTLPKTFIVYMCLCSEPTGSNLSVTNLGSCPYNIG